MTIRGTQESNEVTAPEVAPVLETGNFTTSATTVTVVAGNVLSVVRDSPGQFTITFKRKYPQLLYPLQPVVIGTAGARGYVEAVDVKAGTMTVQVRDTADAVADAAGSVVYVGFLAKNSVITRR